MFTVSIVFSARSTTSRRPAWHYNSQQNSENLKHNRAEVDVKQVRFHTAFKSNRRTNAQVDNILPPPASLSWQRHND